MLTILYETLWQLLHAFISAYETLQRLYLRLTSALLWSYDLINYENFSITPHDKHILSNCKTKLTKIPKHLNFIIGPNANHLNYRDFIRIFTYALFVGINCISICDTRQLFTPDTGGGNVDDVDEKCDTVNSNNDCDGADEKYDLLVKLNNYKGPELKKIDRNHFIWTITGNQKYQQNVNKVELNGKQNGAASNGHLNGYKKNEKTLEIFIFPPREGRPQLVNVSRQLFKQRHTTEMKDILQNKLTILTERIDNELHQHYYSFTDPEMSIILNDDMCTFGLLPWQTRFTEFHLHKPIKYFNAEAFAKLLFRYSRCEQRWGT